MQKENRVYYINHLENDVYREDIVGFTRDTGEKRVMLRNLTDGKYWDIPYKDLAEERLIDGSITNVWERMPAGWYPQKEERPYPGYTNDPRGDINNGYSSLKQRAGSALPAINRYNR